MSRWSRACGTGIGLSGHTNQYRHGALLENWVEDSHALEAYKTGSTLLGAQKNDQTKATSTYMRSFTDEGKVGTQILEQADRKDKDAYKGKKRENLFDHGNMEEDPGTNFCTLNELVYDQPSDQEEKERKVAQHLWMGSKFNDLEVERTSNRPLSLVEKRNLKLEELRNAKPADAFKTHSNEVSEETIRIAGTMREMGDQVKSTLILPEAEGGQKAQIGRKANGQCARSFDMTYRSIGLRK